MNGPGAPSRTEPAVGKDTWAASQTFPQGEVCPLHSLGNA